MIETPIPTPAARLTLAWPSTLAVLGLLSLAANLVLRYACADLWTGAIHESAVRPDSRSLLAALAILRLSMSLAALSTLCLTLSAVLYVRRKRPPNCLR